MSTRPTTPILDRFDRADGAPGPNWVGPAIHPNFLTITSGTVTNALNNGQVGNGFWAPSTFGPVTNGYPVEEYFQMTAFAGAGHADVLIMLDNPTANLATGKGYAMVCQSDNGVTAFRVDPGGSSVIGGPSFSAPAPGNWLWMIYRPNGSLEAWQSADGTNWTRVVQVTDTTYLTSVWYIGMQFDDQTATADNFGGGTADQVGAPAYALPILGHGAC